MANKRYEKLNGSLVMIIILTMTLAFAIIVAVDAVSKVDVLEKQTIELKTELKEKSDELSRRETELDTFRVQNVANLEKYLRKEHPQVPKEIALVIAEKLDYLCHKYEVNFNLFVGMIEVESDFDPYAASSVKARGLLQVRYSVWKEYLKLTDEMSLHNVEDGLDAGIRAFMKCKEESDGDVTEALKRYSGDKSGNYAQSVFQAVGKYIISTGYHHSEVTDGNTKGLDKGLSDSDNGEAE